MEWVNVDIEPPECDTEIIGCCDDDVFECRHYSDGVFFDCYNTVVKVEWWQPKPLSPYQTGQVNAK